MFSNTEMSLNRNQNPQPSYGIRLEAAVREHPLSKRHGNAARASGFRLATPGPGMPGEAGPGLPPP